MAAWLTSHAATQVWYRGPLAGFTEADVVRAVNQYYRQITTSPAWEVLVVVKKTAPKTLLYDGVMGVSLPDGSNGDLVVACVDPTTLAVKTVMLQRSTQVERKARKGEEYYGL